MQPKATIRAAIKVADITRSTSLPASRNNNARLRKSSPFITNPIHETLITDSPVATPISKGESGSEEEVKPATQPTAPTTEERAHARTKQLAELHPARYLRRSASSDGDNWAEFLSRILHKHPELKDAVPTLSGEYFDD